MKSLIVVVAGLMLSGCALFQKPVPVTYKWPAVPQSLLEPCPTLDEINKENPEITELLKIVIENYNTYHECSTKYNTWIEWYHKQKKIMNK